ncbi:DinB family protein [Labedella endophytica]|uniref:DinB family protein n=1 Tax=Labedella endophytica TaxID=1523160 RepID=A0A3S0VIF3_9MICO|nr:DinB family protein [Labedella endophytica]RUR03254.1 DinB family protein [Labedella endophytica]
MPIVPDTKNWTWVLDEPCPECGFDPEGLTFRDVPDRLRTNAAAWPAVLARPEVRERPDDGTWSALEYGAHVRDVFRIFDGRFRLMLERDDPAFPNWDQDATAIEEDYAAQDPAVVADDLVAAAERLTAALDVIPDTALERTALRGDGSRFTVSSLARYLLHDPEHHLHDVTR